MIDFNGKRVTGASNCIQLLDHAAPIQMIDTSLNVWDKIKHHIHHDWQKQGVPRDLFKLIKLSPSICVPIPNKSSSWNVCSYKKDDQSCQLYVFEQVLSYCRQVWPTSIMLLLKPLYNVCWTFITDVEMVQKGILKYNVYRWESS